ncbi:MAG TPA: ATP-binding protein [Ktedonobacteraceae bacterium]|nr:ATP-binding protein [Ktedonobacteraceae bacterium]
MDLQNGKTQTSLSDESNILERVARLISSVRGAKPDYAHLAAELEPALPFAVFGIVLLRHDREAVRVTACQKEASGWVARYHQIPLADSMVERMLMALMPPEPVSVRLVERDAASFDRQLLDESLLVEQFAEGVAGLPAQCGDALCGHPQLRAVLIAPLIAGGKMLGNLELGSTDLAAYADPALRRLIHAVARVLATAIEGAQVGGNVEIQDRQRAELKDVSEVLTSEVDLPRILKRIVTGITNALHVAAAIVRYDGRRKGLYLEAQSQLDVERLQAILARKDILSEQAILGSTLLHRAPRVSQDIDKDERFPASRCLASEMGAHSIYCHPLITGQYIYGTLLLLSPEPGGFTPLKTDIFALFASQATVAIHNGILLQSIQERRRFQDAIEQFEQGHQQNVLSGRGMESEQELLERLRDETMGAFGVSLSSVLRFISDHLLTRSERHLQDILRSSQASSLVEERREADAFAEHRREIAYGEKTLFLVRSSELEQLETSTASQGTAYLMQAADEALAWSGFLRDISAALMRVWNVDETQPQAYDQLKRNLADPLFIVDLQGNCVYCNRAAEFFCGQSSELENAPVWNHWHSKETAPALFSTFRPQATPVSLEQVLTPLLPRVRHLNDVLAYLRQFAVHIVQENELLGENGVPLPAFLRCTIAAEALPGQVPLATVGRDSWRNWAVASAAEPRAIIASPMQQRSQSSPTLLLDNSPSDRHYQLTRHALYDENGQWFANALHVHDVTEQVRDEKNKAVLLASVSHDLRTPLTTIKAAVTGLLQPDVVWDEDIRREILEDIDAEADHLNTLVDALVEMSRIEMGALVLEKEWCDMVELVHSTLLRAHRLLAEFGVNTQIQSPLPLIYADYAQVERALYNLLENAARHSPRHAQIHVIVDVLAQRALPAGLPDNVSRAVRVQVVDQGPGIPIEEHERVFKSLYSMDAQGSGLGLAICRGIVEAHQGRIWVEANEKGGASFVFVLPIAS